ncbi:hypothetical protein CALVIDRAFT_91300 [Calocera viscosa TUFC12733]|uniref:Uncharacterized protein n=1 Tax=Calocera viscosa (strain TUFC12733) TaxID=1330018 RepID=A0A167MTR5_CALVF|nr:hypothetical protein CALVIDRAFT_91300 [Calocera viscosa TUFC12733]
MEGGRKERFEPCWRARFSPQPGFCTLRAGAAHAPHTIAKPGAQACFASASHLPIRPIKGIRFNKFHSPHLFQTTFAKPSPLIGPAPGDAHEWQDFSLGMGAVPPLSQEAAGSGSTRRSGGSEADARTRAAELPPRTRLNFTPRLMRGVSCSLSADYSIVFICKRFRSPFTRPSSKHPLSCIAGYTRAQIDRRIRVTCFSFHVTNPACLPFPESQNRPCCYRTPTPDTLLIYYQYQSTPRSSATSGSSDDRKHPSRDLVERTT